MGVTVRAVEHLAPVVRRPAYGHTVEVYKRQVLNDAEATEAEVADAVEALENSIDGLVEKNTSTGSKNSGSTSANVGNAYGAAGVVSASQSVAANAYVVSCLLYTSRWV